MKFGTIKLYGACAIILALLASPTVSSSPGATISDQTDMEQLRQMNISMQGMTNDPIFKENLRKNWSYIEQFNR